jgi:hypothetical protein
LKLNTPSEDFFLLIANVFLGSKSAGVPGYRPGNARVCS